MIDPSQLRRERASDDVDDPHFALSPIFLFGLNGFNRPLHRTRPARAGSCQLHALPDVVSSRSRPLPAFPLSFTLVPTLPLSLSRVSDHQRGHAKAKEKKMNPPTRRGRRKGESRERERKARYTTYGRASSLGMELESGVVADMGERETRCDRGVHEARREGKR